MHELERVRNVPIHNASEGPEQRERWGRGSYYNRAFLFSFGAYGDTHVAVWERSFDDALESAAEWLSENAPGLFSPPDYEGSATELGLKWNPSEPFEDGSDNAKIRDHAETDLTYTESGYLLSHEWYGREVSDPLELYVLALRSWDKRREDDEESE